MNESSFSKGYSGAGEGQWQRKMSVTVQKLTRKRRQAPDVRRRQLIEATIDSIARKGISGTTLSDVAGTAGLSQGIVNLHFKSKKNLFNETLAFLAEQYAATLKTALDDAGEHPADQLRALIDADFLPVNFNRRSIAVWYAFRGEAKSRPTYRKICRARDADVDATMLSIVSALLDATGRDRDEARPIVDGLTALTDGLWLSYLMDPTEFTRERARLAAHRSVAYMLPDVFPTEPPPGR